MARYFHSLRGLTGDALDKRHNAVQRITFDADEDNVRCILIFLSGAGFHRNGLARSIPDTIDEQAALFLDGCEMCAASDQRHILAALCELATENTASTTGAKYDIFHEERLLSLNVLAIIIR